MLLRILILFTITYHFAYALPNQFVYLHDIDPSIQQEMRYASYHNFIGRPITGYRKNVCLLTLPTAQALARVQRELRAKHYSLKVYDCYRPVMAVQDFIAWSADPKQQEMKAEFYPRVNKSELFDLGYFAMKSGHSRGSTVDLTIVPIPTPKEAQYVKGMPLFACYAAQKQRYQDNSIEMGTGYDCLDEASFWDSAMLTRDAYQHRLLLRETLQKHGFIPYDKEWWHFALAKEPYPQQYFNFPVE